MKKEIQLRDLGFWITKQFGICNTICFNKRLIPKYTIAEIKPPNLPKTIYFLLSMPLSLLWGKVALADHLLTSKAELESQGISFFKIDRGGDITYHGPGQIVGYPILDLDHFSLIFTSTYDFWSRSLLIP